MIVEGRGGKKQREDMKTKDIIREDERIRGKKKKIIKTER